MNYNNQHQAIILKGIANQILQMNVPTFNEVEKMFNSFDAVFHPTLDFISIANKLQERNVIQRSGSWRTFKGQVLFQASDNEIVWKNKELMIELIMTHLS